MQQKDENSPTYFHELARAWIYGSERALRAPRTYAMLEEASVHEEEYLKLRREQLELREELEAVKARLRLAPATVDKVFRKWPDRDVMACCLATIAHDWAEEFPDDDHPRAPIRYVRDHLAEVGPSISENALSDHFEAWGWLLNDSLGDALKRLFHEAKLESDAALFSDLDT